MQAEASLTQFAVSPGEMVPFSLRAQNRFLRFSGGQHVPRQASLKHPEAKGSQGESALAAASSVLLCAPEPSLLFRPPVQAPGVAAARAGRRGRNSRCGGGEMMTSDC